MHLQMVAAASLLAGLVLKQVAGLNFLPIAASVFSASCFLYFLIWRVLIYPHYVSPLRGVSGPPGHWFFGNLREILKENTGIPLRWMQQFPEAPLIRYTGLFHEERLLVVSSQAHKQVLQNAQVFQKPPHISKALRRSLGAKGLLFLEGDVHKRQRKQMNPAFAPMHLRSIVPILLDKARLLTQRWQAGRRFGYEIDSLSDQKGNALADAYQDMFDTTKHSRLMAIADFHLPFVRNLPFKRHRELNQDTAQGVEVGNDLLGLLVQENARKEKLCDPEDPSMTEEEMSDQTMTFLAAGQETTPAAVAWALLALAEQHEEMQNKLRQELHMAAQQDPDWTFERIEALHYLAKVVKEVLRLYSPVTMTCRQAMETAVIEGQIIPAGTNLFICPAATNQNPQVWGSDAPLFKPDRYDTLPAAVTNYSTETFLHGTRSCIGQRFAMTEMKCLLVCILLKFQVQVKPGHVVQVQAAITRQPNDGLPLILQPI